MVFAGDFAQLPPAIGGESKSLYSQSIGIHSTKLADQEDAIGKGLWHQITTVVILRQNMRQRNQSEEDTKLRRALENLRYKSCDAKDISFLRSLNSSSLPGRKSITAPGFRDAPIITGTNAHKDVYNALGSVRYATETGRTLVDFFSDNCTNIPASEKDLQSKQALQLRSLPDDVQKELWNQPTCCTNKFIAGKLSLCIGMPVMIGYNYTTELCMTRGQEGVVVGWQDAVGSCGQRVLDVLFVKLVNAPASVCLDGLPKDIVPIYPRSNTIVCSMPNGDKVIIRRKQVEVLLNFAMTDYASQGKTRVFNPIDLLSLTSHQGYYTALSRCATAAGTLILRGFILNMTMGGCSGFLHQEFRELELLDLKTIHEYEGSLPSSVSGNLRNDIIAELRKWK
ncbi:hypothetical protein BJ165DRAFT_1312378, partial [Panaeolus papilionaceus]